MNDTHITQRNYETIAWGSIFIWWGITELIPGMPEGIGAIGIGLILLGLNFFRSLNGIPTVWFTTVLGVLALVWGGLEMAGALLALPYELPIFGVLLVTLGVLLLGRELIQTRA